MIIVTNGPPASGKDAICEYLKERGFEHIEFKKALFEDTIAYFGVDEKWFFDGYTREQKEKKEELLNGLSRREALIHVSEKVIKPQHGNDYYGLRASEKMEPTKSYCVSDGGFIEELSHIINKFGRENVYMLRLYREGSDYTRDSRKYINPVSFMDTYICGEAIDEQNLDMLRSQSFDGTVDLKCVEIHNNGTLEDLYNVVEDIIRKANGRHDRGKHISS